MSAEDGWPVSVDPAASSRAARVFTVIAPWEILFYASVISAMVVTLTRGQPVRPAAWTIGVIAAGAAMIVWFGAVGRRAVRRSSALPYASCLVLLALFTAAMALSASEVIVLIGLPAIAHTTLPDRWAHPIATVFCFTPSVVVALRTGDLHTTASTMLPISIAGAVFSALIAAGVDRVERRSEERARLIKELEATRARLAEASRRAGVTDERQRLAGEIHDTVAQGLTSMVMLVQAADAVLDTDPSAARRHLALAARTARENLAETRAIVAALTPAPLAEASLPDALRRLGDRFAAQLGIEIDVAVAGAVRVLPMAIDVVLLRAAQEGLANAGKYAGARRIEVRLDFAAERVTLEIADDGRGFDPQAPTAGYGLATMRARLSQVGGVLDIHSGPGAGARLRAEVNA